jgi:hypothetical protein
MDRAGTLRTVFCNVAFLFLSLTFFLLRHVAPAGGLRQLKPDRSPIRVTTEMAY